MLDRFQPLVVGLDHPEGVAWGPDGRVYAGGEDGQVYRAPPGGEPEQYAATGGFVLGVTLDGAGRLYACDLARTEVLRVDPDGTVSTYCARVEGEPLRLPNYSAFDDDGNLYVTDSGAWQAHEGRILRLAPGGEAAVWSEELPRFPNGCCLDAAGTSLFVVESLRPGIWRIPILDGGGAGPAELVAELPGSVPDGIALAVDGTLVVSCYRPDRIYRISPGGEVAVLAEDPHGMLLSAPTNVAFGGEGLDRLLVANTAQHHVAVGDVGLVGLPLRYPDTI